MFAFGVDLEIPFPRTRRTTSIHSSHRFDKIPYQFNRRGSDVLFPMKRILRITHRVILEVLRLHPTLLLNVRYSVKDDTLPDGTRVPVGAWLSFSYHTIGHSVEIWGSDADVFNPERFSESKEPSSFMFPAFHAGPRICLGIPMAFMNIKLVLSMILTSGLDFKDQVAGGGHSTNYNYAITLSMKDSFPIKISRRCCWLNSWITKFFKIIMHCHCYFSLGYS